MTTHRRLRVVWPHQLHESLLEEPAGTRFVLVEDDLLFRHQPFHAQKLVLHRAASRGFVDRLRDTGFDVDVLETSASQPSGARLAHHLEALRPDEVRLLDPVDDWMLRGARAAVAAAGVPLTPDDVEDSPGFLTTRRELGLVRWAPGPDADLLPVAAAAARRPPRR